jgi:hypothetical protein
MKGMPWTVMNGTPSACATMQPQLSAPGAPGMEKLMAASKRRASRSCGGHEEVWQAGGIAGAAGR